MNEQSSLSLISKPRLNKTIQTYNLIADEYDLETKYFWEKFPSQVINKFAKSVKKGFVLDLGSGPGRDGVILKGKGLDIICLDASKTMVNTTIHKGLPSILSDLKKVPFSNNSFRGVWAYTSLLHIPKKQILKALKEINRVLVKTGILGLGMIEGNFAGYRYTSGVDKPRYFVFYTKDELEKLLNEAGFRIFYFDQFKPNSKVYLNFLARKV